MHPFSELAKRCAALTESLVEDRREQVLSELRHGSSTTPVKALQAFELQQAVVAVGLFAMFDAALQDALDCEDGFAGADVLMDGPDHKALQTRFRDLRLAVNVLKHGSGWSHDDLLRRRELLPFVVRAEDDHFFAEGDVGEPSVLLIRVDREFLRYCAETIDLVAEFINRERPGCWL